jgi:hypothetical protein
MDWMRRGRTWIPHWETETKYDSALEEQRHTERPFFWKISIKHK